MPVSEAFHGRGAATPRTWHLWLTSRGLSDHVTHRQLWMVLVLLAPLGAFIRAVLARWTPEGDDATIVLRFRELLHGEFPLQGMRSTTVAVSVHAPSPW